MYAVDNVVDGVQSAVAEERMVSALTDRITEVLQRTEPILRQKSQTCLDCRYGKPGDHATHVAERVAEALNLTEERVVPIGLRRWVSPWTSAKEKR
jgi:DNA-directed RNA polymerase sigma subunit (sigma70/sigma32)